MAEDQTHIPADSAPRHQTLIDAALRQASAVTGVRLIPPALRDALRGYRILGELRRGGQGTVYRAVQQSTGRDVAIKIMHGGHVTRPTAWARFEREIKILARLRHPNIVTIHDSGAADGEAYFVMDFIHGAPLDAWIGDPQRLRDIRRTLTVFATICDAAHTAHLQGIIHRDLKPSNILIDAHDQPQILDLGLAKLIEESETDSDAAQMTHTGQFVGSLPWASPEQVDEGHERVDIRTDVYSLGVLLYQLLTGAFPYPVNVGMREAIDHVMHTSPQPPRRLRTDIDDELEAIVLRCLAKEPARRYQSAGELARDIRRYLAGEPVEAKRDSGFYLLRKQMRRYRGTVTVGVLFLLMLVGSSVLAWSLYARAESARAEASARSTDATARLWESYLAQARANRASNRVGRRFDSLAALARAAAIRPELLLRDEAVACLALSDLEHRQAIQNVHAPQAIGLRTLDRYAHSPRRGAISVRALADGRALQSFTTPDMPLHSMQFDAEGRYLAVRLKDGQTEHLFVGDVSTGRTLLELSAERFLGTAFTFGGGVHERWIAVADVAGRINLYSLPDCALRHVLTPPETPAYLGGHPSEPLLAVTAYDERVLAIWNIAQEQELRRITSDAELFRITWSWDGRLLAGAGLDYGIHLWRTEDLSLVRTLRGHQAPVIETLFHPDRPLLASWAWDDTTRLWDLSTGGQLLEPIEELRVGGFDGSLILRSYDDSAFGIWRLRDDTPCLRLQAPEQFGVPGYAELHPDNRWLATAGANGVWLWDMHARRPAVRVSENDAWQASFSAPLEALVVVDSRTGVQLYPLADLHSAAPRVGPVQQVHSAEQLQEGMLLPDGRRQLICDQQIELLELPSGSALVSFPGHAGMERPSITPDARWIFTGSWQGDAAHVWDAQTGASVARFPGNSIRGRFSPDGRWLLIATGEAHELYEVGNWRLVYKTPRARTDYRLAAPVAFSPDSRTAAVMYSRYNVRLLETATGQPLVTLPNLHHFHIINMRFSADGRGLILVTTTDAVLVWDLTQVREALRQIGLDWPDPQAPS